MTPGEIVAMVAALLTSAGIGGIISAWINTKIASRKAPSEIKHTNASTEKTEAEAAKADAETADIIVKAAGNALILVKQEFERQINGLNSANSTLSCEIEALKSENIALRGVQQRHEQEITELQKIAEQFDEVLSGAHILFDQVVALNGQPKYKPPERRKKT